MGEDIDSTDEDAVNIVELFRTLRNNSGLIKKITAVFLGLGLIVAILSPVEYESEAVLMPEMQKSEGQTGGLLQSYGGMLGLGDLSSLTSPEKGMITPQVYPMIVQSPSFQNKLLRDSFYFSDLDTTLTGYRYFEEFYVPSFFELLSEYTIKLPRKIFGPAPLPEIPEWLQGQFSEEEITRLTEDQLEIVEDMNDRIEIELDIETGVLDVKVLMPDAVAAAQTCRKVISMLKDFVKEYSTQKAKEDLAFAEVQYKQAQEKFEEAQQNLAQYLDQNVNLTSAKARAREQRLQAEFDIAYNRYNTVSEKLMEAKVKVQEHTPVFKTIQEVNVPTNRSNLPAIIILIISLLAGLLCSFLFIAGRDIYYNLKQKL